MKVLGIANVLFLLGFAARETDAFSVSHSQLSRSRQQGAIGDALALRQPSTTRGHIRLSTDKKCPRQSKTQLPALLEIVGTSAEPIHTAFSIATFFPQPFWLLLILLPKSKITKTIMGGMEVVLLCCLLHFFIVATSIVQPDATAPLAEFNDVFDPNGDPQKAFMKMVTNYPNFVSEEWSHVLTWDLFVGRWIWLDGLKRGIFTSHSVLFANLIGPPGLLIHWVTCLLTGKGFVGNEAPEEEEL